MASRYWRIFGVETYGYRANLALGGLGLYESGTRVDASATLTSTSAPIGGALSNLQDSDTATTAVFGGAAVASPGFALVWDFGAGNEKSIDQLRAWATADTNAFLYGFRLEDSADGQTWVVKSSYSGVPCPVSGSYVTINVREPYYQSVSLFINGDGADGSIAIFDSSISPKSISTYGNTSISTSVKKHGSGSVFFDGTGDYLTAQINDGCVFYTGDFTVEAWIYLPTTPSGSYAAIVDTRQSPSGSAAVLFLADSDLRLGYYYSGDVRSASGTLQLNTWMHVALCRASNTTRLFVDGVQVASVADNDYKTETNFFVGRVYDNAHPPFSGYIDDLRVTKGVARYTSNFTPPGEDALGYTKTPRLLLQSSLPDFHADFEDWGGYRITGTVKEKATPTNTPLRRRVRLHYEKSGCMVRETWSDATTGAYSFDNIRGDQTYFVVSFDHTHNYRAVIADNLTPEVMP